jgi:hypothetical protein
MKLLTVQLPPSSCHSSIESIYFQDSCKYFATYTIFFTVGGVVRPPPNCQARGPPRQLSATPYSTYSQLPSISGGHLFYPQPVDAPYCWDKGPTKQGHIYCSIVK